MKVNKNAIASANTINNLMSIARAHFSNYGYEKTSLEAISSEANMTRGSVYHHFKSKKALFLAVLVEVQEEVGMHVESEAMSSDDEWEQLIRGCIGFVEAATKESNRRIFLIDAINVTDWETWRDLDIKNSAALLAEHLQVLMASGVLVSLEPNLIAHLVSGALNELSLHLAQSKDILTEDIRPSIEYLLKGFKRDGN